MQNIPLVQNIVNVNITLLAFTKVLHKGDEILYLNLIIIYQLYIKIMNIE